MRALWWIPISILVAGAGWLIRARLRRRHTDVAVITDPVSADWLAQARGRDEHHW